MTKANAGFDLGSIDTIQACNKAAEIEILHPVTRAPTGVLISVLGKDSDVYRSLVRGFADEKLRQQAVGRGDIATLEKMEKQNNDALAAVTTGWRTVERNDKGEIVNEKPRITLSGEELEFSQANALRVYQRIIPVREQVAEAVNNLENFMPSS